MWQQLPDIKGRIFLSRIDQAFNQKKALIGFLTGGDPSIEKTIDYILEMEKAGVDLVTSGLSIYFGVKGLGLAFSKLEAKQNYFDSLKAPDSYKTFLPEGHPDLATRTSTAFDGGPKGGTSPA